MLDHVALSAVLKRFIVPYILNCLRLNLLQLGHVSWSPCHRIWVNGLAGIDKAVSRLLHAYPIACNKLRRALRPSELLLLLLLLVAYDAYWGRAPGGLHNMFTLDSVEFVDSIWVKLACNYGGVFDCPLVPVTIFHFAFIYTTPDA